MELVCKCGRTFTGDSICPICIAEIMTGRNITDISKEEYAVALEIFKNHPHISDNLLIISNMLDQVEERKQKLLSELSSEKQ